MSKTFRDMNSSSSDLAWTDKFPFGESASSMINATAFDMERANESSSIQAEEEKRCFEEAGITSIPKTLRYSTDSSNTFMHKQNQVSGAAFGPASVGLWSLRTSDGLGSVSDLSSNWPAHQRPGFYSNRCLPLWIVAYPREAGLASHFSVSRF